MRSIPCRNEKEVLKMGILSPLLAVRNIRKTIEFCTNILGFEMGIAFPDAEKTEYFDLSKDGMVLMVISEKDHGISVLEKNLA